MPDTRDALRHEVALFRYGLISDVLELPPGSPGLYQRLQEKAARAYIVPGSPRTRVAAETLRDSGSSAIAPAASMSCYPSVAPTAVSPGVCPPRSPTGCSPLKKRTRRCRCAWSSKRRTALIEGLQKAKVDLFP